MTYRLLHIADVHLDRSFLAPVAEPGLGRRRRQGLREAVQAAGQAALAAGCAAVTVGGDLYEHDRAGVDTERFLQDTFASWQPMRVFIAPGNHDALVPGSLYRRVDWPDNVHIFGDAALAPIELQDGLTLWGLAHREPAWQGNPLPGDLLVRGGVHLALFHGAELGSRPAGKALHGPFRAQQIRDAGFAAALCGHYHNRRIDPATGLTYPGSPEPLCIDETGNRGPVLVSVNGDGSVDMEGLTLNRWSAHMIECDCSSIHTTVDAFDAMAVAATTCLADSDAERSLLRIDCTGSVDPALSIDVATAALTVRERCGAAQVTVVDRTLAAFDMEELAREESARAAFLHLATTSLREAPDEESAAVVQDAIRYGLAALSGAEVGLR